MDSVNCPWCGHTTYLQMIDLEHGGHEHDCDECEKRFEYEVDVTISGVGKIESDEEE